MGTLREVSPDFPEPQESGWVVLMAPDRAQPPVNVKLTSKAASLRGQNRRPSNRDEAF